VSVWGFDKGIAWEAFVVYAEFVEFLEGFYHQGMVGFEHFDKSVCGLSMSF
jgi:hypothetical protein